MNIYNINSNGGGANGRHRFHVTSNQQRPSGRLGLYAAVIIDFDSGDAYLTLISAATARAAESQLGLLCLKGEIYGVVELTPELRSWLYKMASDDERSGPSCISFIKSPRGGYKFAGTAQTLTPVHRENTAVAVEPASLRLFASLARARSTNSFQLFFVRALDCMAAREQVTGKDICPTDIFIVAVGPRLLGVLGQLLQRHHVNQMTVSCLQGPVQRFFPDPAS
jgi:hypothetical protein